MLLELPISSDKGQTHERSKEGSFLTGRGPLLRIEAFVVIAELFMCVSFFNLFFLEAGMGVRCV